LLPPFIYADEGSFSPFGAICVEIPRRRALGQFFLLIVTSAFPA
jgi:hypothetical protein